MMSEMILYHGSPVIVRKPEYGKGKTYNDYGQGFYCTEHVELAKEWAVNEGDDGYVIRYSVDTSNFKILNLSSDNYNILHWLALLLDNRRFRISTPVMGAAREWLINNYLIDISSYDAIIGYRADDSYFSFARAFLDNTISVDQLSYAMSLGELGEQFVLKSRKAFDMMHFDSYETVFSSEYYPKRKMRDETARKLFNEELEKGVFEGIYIRDLIRGGVSINDAGL